MDIRSLRFAVTLAEELHFGRAAARHYIAAQAFGRQIRRLERNLGTALFDRTSRRVELTAAGERLVGRARMLLAELDGLVDEVAERDPGDGTPLRIGVLGFGAAERWADLRSAVNRISPRTELAYVDLDLESQYDAVRHRQVDVAVVQYVGPIDGLDFTEVLEVPRVAVVPVASPLADATRLAATDLAGVESIQLVGGHPGLLEWAGPFGDIRAGGPKVRHPAAIVPAVAMTGSVSVHGEPAGRYYPHPDVAFVPMDGPPCRVAIAVRHGDGRAGVHTFRRAAEMLADADRNQSGT